MCNFESEIEYSRLTMVFSIKNVKRQKINKTLKSGIFNSSNVKIDLQGSLIAIVTS